MNLLISCTQISGRHKISIYDLLIVFILSPLICFIYCSEKTKDTDTQDQAAKEVIPSKDALKSKNNSQSLLKLKQKIVSKRKNPVLNTARQNALFISEKWLKSDYAFFKRLNPRRVSEYDPIIKKMARRYGFDWRLIAAQIYTESNFKNKAKSRVGATGLMQIMPGTAKFMGFDPNSMIKPELNISVGCMYNQRMYNLWGKQTKDYNRLAFSLASYNAGRGRVLKSYSTKKSLTTWGKVHRSLPEETQSYVHKIYLKHYFYKKYILP